LEAPGETLTPENKAGIELSMSYRRAISYNEILKCRRIEDEDDVNGPEGE
jgi:hypothetical protein